jgi:hypothetical protein
MTAIHAAIDYEWIECSNLVNYNYSDVEASVIPIYEFFFDNANLQILVFSGTIDTKNMGFNEQGMWMRLYL